MTKNAENTLSEQSKIRGRVFSPDTSGSKMGQLLAETSFAPRVLSRGETVEGKVVAILADSVLMDVGVKAEGIIPLKELQEQGEEPKIGDKISAVVAQPEGDSGVAILTVRRATKEKGWGELQEIADRSGTTEVKGLEANRGGLIVDYKGIRGFIPSSHLVTSVKGVFGKNLSVKIIEVNKNFNKLVFSEKEASSESLPKLELPFKVGDALDVGISKILPFGLLVSLPGSTDGLIHISEISWKKVEDLSEIYKIGEGLKAKVISIDPGTCKVNLSIKQLSKDPWTAAAKEYKVGTVLERKISRVTSYGAFVEIEEGIEGLLHSSKIPYGLELKVGESVTVSIDLFNSEQRRVALRLALEDKTVATEKIGATRTPKEKIAAPDNASGVSRGGRATTETPATTEAQKKTTTTKETKVKDKPTARRIGNQKPKGK